MSDADADELRLVTLAETDHVRRTPRTIQNVLTLAASLDGGRTVGLDLPPPGKVIDDD